MKWTRLLIEDAAQLHLSAVLTQNGPGRQVGGAEGAIDGLPLRSSQKGAGC